MVYCYSKITVLLQQLNEKSIQSGDITQKVAVLFGVKCRLFHFCALPSTDALHQHIPSPPPLPVPPAWRYIGACVGVIVGRHCRNLAAAVVWRAAPR